MRKLYKKNTKVTLSTKPTIWPEPFDWGYYVGPDLEYGRPWHLILAPCYTADGTIEQGTETWSIRESNILGKCKDDN